MLETLVLKCSLHVLHRHRNNENTNPSLGWECEWTQICKQWCKYNNMSGLFIILTVYPNSDHTLNPQFQISEGNMSSTGHHRVVSCPYCFLSTPVSVGVSTRTSTFLNSQMTQLSLVQWCYVSFLRLNISKKTKIWLLTSLLPPQRLVKGTK